MRWASQVVVVIWKETHNRPWVNWEIQVAHQLGKPIIGVYENGLKGDVKLPENLEKYATSIVAWRSDAIINALEGKTSFENLMVRIVIKFKVGCRMPIEPNSYLYVYAITRDFGFAPNPFHGSCTLATCKPELESLLKWVIGYSELVELI
jgi:hypothetical protein